MEEEWKTNAAETSPHCPRCGSSNTKFCYYNNYSLTQPRYFCKGCRRYWTKGGSLRNVPVGGGCKKTQRGKSLRSSSNDHRASSSKNLANGVASNCPRPHSSYANSTSIDLAVVYANFLNPSNNAFSDTILSHGPTVDIHSNNNNNNNEMYFCELSSFQKQQETSNNNGLPPLPGEEVSTWLSSDQMMVPVHNQLQPTRFSGGIEEEAQDLNQLVGDHWIPFDLPSYDTFSTGLK